MRCAGEAVHHAVPDSGFHPASEAIVAGDVGGHSAVAPHAKEHPIAEPRKCRSARDGHQHEAHLAACWATAAESRATRGRSDRIGP